MKKIISVLASGLLLFGCSKPASGINGATNTDPREFQAAVDRSQLFISAYVNVTRKNLAIPQDANDEVDLPPDEYIHPFQGTIYIQWARYWDIGLVCNLPNSIKWVTEACELSDQRTSTECHIILPLLYKGDEQYVQKLKLIDIFVHERGHCNGWEHPVKG